MSFMVTHKRYEKLLQEFSGKRELYSEFSKRLQDIISDVLILKEQEYLSIEYRVKSIESLKRKLYSTTFSPDTLTDINDLSGVRVITYVYENISSIEEVIKDCFDVEQVEVEERLGVDRVGYRSHHWIISLPVTRTVLPEYEKYAGMKAELQIRTVLQHAWAQIGHNQVYKPSAVLPPKIERDFSLLSGVLELADNEFNRISNEILAHQKEVEQRTSAGDLNIPIDSVSLRQYFNDKFAPLTNVQQVFGPLDNMIENIIEELNQIGIHTLRDFDAMVPKEFVSTHLEKETNFTGLARELMILHDPEQYFEKAWKETWVMEEESKENYRELGIDIDSIIEKHPKLEASYIDPSESDHKSP